MPVNRTNIHLALGDLRYLPFRLRRDGGRTYWNVSGATRIQIEYTKVGDEAPLSPVICSPTAVGADWANGLVQALVTPADATARVGTYEYALVVYDGHIRQTAGAGRLEVLPSSVETFPTSDGRWASTSLEVAPNAGMVPMQAGQPVQRVSTGVVLAGADPLDVRLADGVAVGPALPGSLCLYIPIGMLTLDDWTPIFGAPSFPVGSTIYLDKVSGKLTTTLPDLPDFGARQVIGETANLPQTLNVTLEYSVIL